MGASAPEYVSSDVARRRAVVRSVVAAQVSEPNVADDLVQETLARVLESPRSLGDALSRSQKALPLHSNTGTSDVRVTEGCIVPSRKRSCKHSRLRGGTLENLADVR